jgi:hypothetical protein
MSTSIVDGTVEEVVPGRRRGAINVFKSIRFQQSDGTSRTVTKAVVNQEVADELVPGAKGRFYLFNAFDIRGIHGVRTSEGREVYAFPTNNQRLFLIAGIVSLAWIILKIAVHSQVPLLGVALLILSAVGWHFMGKGQAEAKRQFDGDGPRTARAAPADV